MTIEAIKERETLNELAANYDLSPVTISRWKKEFLENSAAAFETSKMDDAECLPSGYATIGDRDTRKRLISPESKLYIRQAVWS